MGQTTELCFKTQSTNNLNVIRIRYMYMNWFEARYWVTYIPGKDEGTLFKMLKADKVRIFQLANIFSDVELFKVVMETFPLNPLLSGQVIWAAFEDSLFEGLSDITEKNIAVVWSEASRFARDSCPEFETAIASLSTVAQELESQQKQMRIFLIDNDGYFKSTG